MSSRTGKIQWSCENHPFLVKMLGDYWKKGFICQFYTTSLYCSCSLGHFEEKPILWKSTSMAWGIIIMNYMSHKQPYPEKSEWFTWVFFHAVRRHLLCKKKLKIHFLCQNMRLRNKSHKIKKNCHILQGHMQLFIFLFFFSFQSGSPLNWPKPLEMAKICPKKVRIPHFLVGRTLIFFWPDLSHF